MISREWDEVDLAVLSCEERRLATPSGWFRINAGYSES
jgi:hypothetical protein